MLYFLLSFFLLSHVDVGPVQQPFSEGSGENEESTNQIEGWNSHGVIKHPVKLFEEGDLTLNEKHDIEGGNGEENYQCRVDCVAVS